MQQPSKFFDIFDVNTNINNLKYTLLYLTNLKKLINFEIKAIYKSDAINNEIEGSGFKNRASVKSLQGKVIFQDKKEKFLFLGALEYIQIKNQERKSNFYFADIESRHNIKPKSTLSIVARNVFSVGKIDLLNIYANTVVFRSQEILPQLFLMKFTQSF